MDNFLDKGFLKQTIDQATAIKKINLTKDDVSLQFLFSRIAGNDYKIRFLVSIHPVNKVFTSMIPNQIRASQINMVSLHDAILANINEKDKKYVTLVSFDTMKCDFKFNYDKWLSDALTNVMPKTFFSKFDQEYKLKVQPPQMILNDITRENFFDFITKKFKEYIEKKNYEKKWLGPFVPKDWQKALNIKLITMFDYEYDYMNNRFIVRLKTPYILGGAMLLGAGIEKIKKENFAIKVERNKDNTNWNDFIKRKFM